MVHRGRNRTWRRVVAVVGLAAILAVSCTTTPTVDTPAGFAGFESAELPTAISAEGVGFRLRSVENEPAQTLDFWAHALERHLTESGYLPRERTPFRAPAGDGIAFEWIAPVGADDWAYLVAIVVTGTEILIAEAAGPVELYDRHRAALGEALETIDLVEQGPAR